MDCATLPGYMSRMMHTMADGMIIIMARTNLLYAVGTAWVGAPLTPLASLAGSCTDLVMACVTSVPDMVGGSDTVATALPTSGPANACTSCANNSMANTTRLWPMLAFLKSARTRRLYRTRPTVTCTLGVALLEKAWMAVIMATTANSHWSSGHMMHSLCSCSE